MGLSCGMSMVKYGLFVFNLICAVSRKEGENTFKKNLSYRYLGLKISQLRDR